MSINKSVVIARLDPVGDGFFAGLKQTALSMQSRTYANSADWPPHITIAAYENMNEADLCAWTEACAEKFAPFSIHFDELRIFPRPPHLETEVIYAAPAPSEELTALHYAFHARYDEFCGNYGRQCARTDYTFHSTLTICHAEETSAVLDSLQREFRPTTARIVALEVYRNPCEFVARYELNTVVTPNPAETVRSPQIFRLTQEDLPAALAVIHESFSTVAAEFGLTRENCPKHTSFLPLAYLQTQMAWGWCMFGLYASNQLIGYLSLSEVGEGVFELHNLAVLPAYRHRGFGKLLLDHAKETVRRLNGHTITLGLIDEDTRLKDWYTANGFVYVGARKYD
ncbi:MAG: GNAT family N-acetyltransferase, partial [Clostridia bacterium]|nr:GNAT family N-acetyltransferase [Clostridia bacterium]